MKWGSITKIGGVPLIKTWYFFKLEQNPYMELKLNTIAWPPCKGFSIALKKYHVLINVTPPMAWLVMG